MKLIALLQLACLSLFINATEIKDLNTSQIPLQCASFKQKNISKDQTLDILRPYLQFFRGKPHDAETVKAFTASALDQHFSYLVLHELALHSGAFFSIHDAQELYEKHENKNSASTIMQELKILNLERTEIIREIQQKLTIQNYKKTLASEILIGEAELRLIYSQKPHLFQLSKTVYVDAFKIAKPLDADELKSIELLLRQGLSLEQILKQKKVQRQSLKDLQITEDTHQHSPFSILLNSAPLSLHLVQEKEAHFLCLIKKTTPARPLKFSEIELQLESKLKNQRINKLLEKKIQSQLKLAQYKNFLK